MFAEYRRASAARLRVRWKGPVAVSPQSFARSNSPAHSPSTEETAHHPAKIDVAAPYAPPARRTADFGRESSRSFHLEEHDPAAERRDESGPQSADPP